MLHVKTMNTGHGNHWECLQKPAEEAIQHIIPATIAKGKLRESVRRVGMWFDQGELREETVHSLALGNRGLGSMVLLVTESANNRSVLATAYPYASKGKNQRLILKEIRDWGNEIEAVLLGENNKGDEIAFFDTQYFTNRDRYHIGDAYNFRISGVIYSARCTNEETITITDQEQIAAFQVGMPGEPERLPDGTLAPLVIHYEGCAGYVRVSSDYPEDAGIYCVIEKVVEFELEGIRIFQITPKSGDGDVPLPGLIFGAASVFKDSYIPKPGDSIGGGLWTQGFLNTGSPPQKKP